MDAALVGMLLQSWQDGAVDDEIFSEQLADIAAAGKLRKNQILLTLRQRRAWDAPSLTTALDSLIASTTLSSSGDSELLSDDFRRQENAWFNDRNPTSAEEERRDVHAAAQFEADAAYARRIATEGADAAYAQRIANESARADAVAEAERLEQQAADAALAQRMSSQIIIDDLASEAGAVGAAGGVGDAGGGAFPTPPKGLHSSRAASGAGPFRPRMVRMPSTQQDEELDRAWGHSGSAGYDGGGSSSSSSSSSRRTSSRNRSLDDEARRILLEIESTGAAIESGGGAEGAVEPFHFIDPDFQPGSEGCGMPDPRAEVHHAMDHDFGSAGGASPPPLEWSRPEHVEYDAGSGSLQQKYASLTDEGSSGGLFLPFGGALQKGVGFNLFSSSSPGSGGNAGEVSGVSGLVARNRLRVKGSAESIWKLFDGPPSAEDVQQGRLGDCWFLSALSVLAEYDGGRLVQRLFPGDQTEGFSLGSSSSSSSSRGGGGGNGGGGNGRSVVVPASRYGAYVVRLCRGGDWENVVVDDSFPTNPTEGGKYLRQFAFARTRGCRLWVPLVEKAYAKLCRGYRHIIGGQTAEALHVLTGWPCEQYRLSGSEKHGSEPAPSPSSRRTADNNDEDDGLPDSGSSAAERAVVDVDDLWAKLLSSSEAGYIICTSTGTDAARCESVGLVPNHAYAVTRVCEVTEPFSGRRERLLRLRNPHGSTNGWKGAWHHGDTQRWTPELRVSCDVDGGGGGSSSSFWIALADAVRYFDQCTVCRVRKNWAEARGLGCFMPPRIIATSQTETAAASNAWEQRPSSGCSASTRSASSWADGGAEFDAWQVQAFARSEVVIDISQPAPRVSASGLCDLAVAVLRLSGSGDSGSGIENGVDIRDARLHATCPSRIAPTICCETWFEEGARYVIVPLAFNHAPTRARRPFSVAVLSSQGVTLDKYRLSPAASRQVVCAYACSPGAAKTRLWHGIQVSSRGDGCTLFVHVRNGNQGGQQQLPQSLGDVFGLGGTDHAFGGNFGNLLAGNSGTGLHFELMLKNMINMTHSRGTNSSFSVSGEGEFATIDDVPPGHSMLIAIVAPVAETYGYASATRYSTRPRMSSLDSSSSPSAVVDSIHALHPSPGV